MTLRLEPFAEWHLDDVAILVEDPEVQRVADRCGHVREGVMRSMHLEQGIRRDMEPWSRLPSDPATP